MHSSIARQAIFDPRQRIVAYELLYREGGGDYFPHTQPEHATQSVLNEAFAEPGAPLSVSDGLPCFINFSYPDLIEGTALRYPPRDLVVEVLENCPTDPALYVALEQLKAQGYLIALDDFIPTADWLAFLRFADIVKIDFRTQSLKQIEHFVTSHRPQFNFKLLAEKIETEEEYRIAKALGFDLFQGFQLCKPERLCLASVA